jgi:Flp pilus assembly pilin Flp
MLHFIDALLGLYASPEQRMHADQATAAGQGLVEYALIIAFIAIVVIVALIYFSSQLTTTYSRIGNSIPQS